MCLDPPLSHVRYSSFMKKKKNAPSNQSKSSSRVTGLDPTILPPSKTALLQKVKRNNPVAWLWKRAVCRKSYKGLEPSEDRWCVESNKYHIHWYDGAALPGNLETNAEEETDTKSEQKDLCSDDSSSDGSCEKENQ